MTHANRGQESTGGVLPYLDVLKLLHESLAPDFYLEVGVRNGGSLRLAKGHAIGVDPAANLTYPLGMQSELVTATSDDFFSTQAASRITRPVDLAFIDGMHLFEYALRDFINIECYASPYGLVVIDDIFPNHPLQAARDRKTRVWTGDVWKLRACLQKWRPDLHMLMLDTSPTGLMLIYGLEPGNDELSKNMEAILGTYLSPEFEQPPEEVLTRKGALRPDMPLLGSVLRGARAIRHSGVKREEFIRLLTVLTAREDQ